MHKPSTSQAMGSGGGGLFSSNSSSTGYMQQCGHFNHGSSLGASSSQVSNARCDCLKCTYCQQFLGNISVKCSECINFHLCLKCFSMSAEIGEHKKDHNYFLKSTMSFPLFDSEKLWTYKEELHLLQFIEQYGFDNWEEIGKNLPNRTAEECMQHYHSYYIYGNLGKNTFTNSLKNKLEAIAFSDYTSTNGQSSQSPDVDEFKVEDPTLDNKSEMTTTVLLPPLEMSLEEQRALGYMPLRDDFEREYKNDGEQLLSNLNIANNQLVLLNNNNNSENNKSTNLNPNQQTPLIPSKQETNSNSLDPDDVVDFDLKLTLVEMYRECLQERQRFKKIAREYGLVNNASALLNKQKVIFAQAQQNGVLLAPNGLSFNHVSNKKRIKKSTLQIVDYKEMSEVNEKLKKYAQFMSVSEYETLIDNLRKQRQICKKIQELQAYRSNGLTKLSEIESLKKEQMDKAATVINRKRKRKSYQFYADSPNKRMTRRQNHTNNSLLYNSISNNHNNSKLDNTLNETNLTDLNISNIRNFSPNSSTNSSRSSSTNRSRSNSQSNSSNSMNMYELVEKTDNNADDLVSEDLDQADEDGENDENLDNDQLFTDEDENEASEDLSSGGAASSGGSGINEPNIGPISSNNHFGRRLRTLSNRRNNSLIIKNKKKKNKKMNMSLNTTSTTSKKMLNASLNKSNLKRTNLLLKSAKSPNGLNGSKNNKMSKKLKLLDLQRHGRSERLCSMPGYNLLSENEKKLISSIDLKPSDYINYKTNLIKNSLARRKQKTVDQQITSYFSVSPRFTSPASPKLNETYPNPSSAANHTPSKMLRRTSLNGSEPETRNIECNNLTNHFLAKAAAINNPDSSVNDSQNGVSNLPASSKKINLPNNKLMSILMKTTCPEYFQIPIKSRKRILRFLCDNGWIDVS